MQRLYPAMQRLYPAMQHLYKSVPRKKVAAKNMWLG